MSESKEPPVFTLIEGGDVYDPAPRGPATLLLIGERIGRIGQVDGARVAALDLPCETIDARGCYVVPGLIDPHTHLTGAGGEEGFGSRTPEVPLDELIREGVTTVVGCLGTDTITRHLTALLGKVRELESQGLTAFMYTGGFPVPTPTITDSIMQDLIVVDKVIGTGEIAIADGRAIDPSLEELAKLVSATHLGGLVAGKAGITHFHVGPAKGRLSLLRRLLDEHDIPAERLYPTHIERSPELMDEAIALARRGAYVDIDTVEQDLPKWVTYYEEHDGPPDQLTVSSDRHAGTGEPALYSQLVACVREHRKPLERVLPFFTRNTAAVLKLGHKGRLQEGGDADLLVIEKGSLDIRHVIARGRRLVAAGPTG